MVYRIRLYLIIISPNNYYCFPRFDLLTWIGVNISLVIDLIRSGSTDKCRSLFPDFLFNASLSKYLFRVESSSPYPYLVKTRPQIKKRLSSIGERNKVLLCPDLHLHVNMLLQILHTFLWTKKQYQKVELFFIQTCFEQNILKSVNVAVKVLRQLFRIWLKAVKPATLLKEFLEKCCDSFYKCFKSIKNQIKMLNKCHHFSRGQVNIKCLLSKLQENCSVTIYIRKTRTRRWLRMLNTFVIIKRLAGVSPSLLTRMRKLYKMIL